MSVAGAIIVLLLHILSIAVILKWSRKSKRMEDSSQTPSLSTVTGLFHGTVSHSEPSQLEGAREAVRMEGEPPFAESCASKTIEHTTTIEHIEHIERSDDQTDDQSVSTLPPSLHEKTVGSLEVETTNTQVHEESPGKRKKKRKNRQDQDGNRDGRDGDVPQLSYKKVYQQVKTSAPPVPEDQNLDSIETISLTLSKYKGFIAPLMEALSTCTMCGSATTFPVRSKRCSHPVCLFCLNTMQHNATTAPKNYVEQRCRICNLAYPSGRGSSHPKDSIAMCTLFEPAFSAPCFQDIYLCWLESLYEKDTKSTNRVATSPLLSTTSGLKEAALRAQVQRGYDSFFQVTRQLLNDMKCCLYPCDGCGEAARSPSNWTYYLLHGIFQCKPRDMTTFPPTSMDILFDKDFHSWQNEDNRAFILEQESKTGEPFAPMKIVSPHMVHQEHSQTRGSHAGRGYGGHDEHEETEGEGELVVFPKSVSSVAFLTESPKGQALLSKLNEKVVIAPPTTTWQQLEYKSNYDLYKKKQILKHVLGEVATPENVSSITEVALYLGNVPTKTGAVLQQVCQQLDRVIIHCHGFKDLIDKHKPVTEFWAAFETMKFVQETASLEGTYLASVLDSRYQMDLLKLKREKALLSIKKKSF